MASSRVAIGTVAPVDGDPDSDCKALQHATDSAVAENSDSHSKAVRHSAVVADETFGSHSKVAVAYRYTPTHDVADAENEM